MTECPLCRVPSTGLFLTRHRVSVHQNLVVDSPEAARALREGTLELHVCESCGFVFNAAFDPAVLQYGAAYDNTQTCSIAFREHMEERADRIVRDRGIHDATIVEVGCGKGDFLTLLAQRDSGNRGVGYDPSYVGPATALDGRIRFERRFYDAASAAVEADAVVCRHVIEHVPRPVELLRTIRETLHRGNALVFFETPCVEWILRNEVVWDFFYEHCSYFSASSLTHAFALAGFDVDVVNQVFGGQYLWIEGRKSACGPGEARSGRARASGGGAPRALKKDDKGKKHDGAHIADLAQHYAAREAAVVNELRARIRELAFTGPVAIWGAAAKGTTLANLVDPDATLLACIIDINPNKQGKFLPGSGHPIVGPRDAKARGVRTALVTNLNYFEETARIVRDEGLGLELVDAMPSKAHADTD